MKAVKLISLLLFVFLSGIVHGQKQLVVLKNEKVLLRLYPGDNFVYRLRGSKSIKRSYVNNIFDTAVVVHRDTVPFRSIDRLYFRQHKLYNTVGTALVMFGAGLFLIDQLNVVVVNGREPDLDDNVTRLSASSLVIGLPMMLIKKRSQKIGHRVRMMMVEKGSGFYVPDRRRNSASYLDN